MNMKERLNKVCQDSIFEMDGHFVWCGTQTKGDDGLNDWSVEDAFIWFENGRFYCLTKDFHGYFTKAGKNQVALFECEDGISWHPAEDALAYTRHLTWEDGTDFEVRHLERPQIYLEDGKPVCLRSACALYEDENTSAPAQSSATRSLAACAALESPSMSHTFNICIPIVQ